MISITPTLLDTAIKRVVFDAPIDGSTLDADWLHSSNNNIDGGPFIGQVDPVTADWTFTGGDPVIPGDNWNMNRDQPGLTPGQSGTIS